ncbi:glycosyltransferase family 2 protein (plasmid) [Pseudorhodobacter turbinis]|uniref:Glycosyltransferase family 2 protein n=1 Tax=Pseudorhodobacter turbinis TaxID=2500533 RepID=A0A4P8EM21_9RHOB|nr:glycosyltransferase family A protein [Pseudorhodobacter turbinis]QCO58156.1 glycosyltransferase family 2 protein [Pseudorhodobacter turbinis]
MTADITPSLPSGITVAIATIGARINGIILPAPTDGLRYEVLVQMPPDVLPINDRPDLRYTAINTRGLSHSRNSALTQCETPFLVFADDDMELDVVGLKALAAELARAPDLAFAAGWRAGRLPVTGPRAGAYRLRKLNAGRICAPELMVCVAPLRRHGITFDTRFGVGAEYPVGEDYIFTCDMLDAGLCGAAFPIVTGAHPHLSTGDNWHDAGLLVARRAVLSRCFGSAAVPVLLAYALRHRKHLGGWRDAWRFLTAKG